MTHATQSASDALLGSELRGGTPSGMNGAVGSFNGSTGPVALLQNSGDNVAQNAQNVLARATACPCGGTVIAEATGAQIAHLSMHQTRIEGVGGGNMIMGSFTGTGGMVAVAQNAGRNVAQNAQNSLALIVRRP